MQGKLSLVKSNPNKGLIYIEVEDEHSGINFIEIKITKEEFTEALLYGLINRPCEFTLKSIGKECVTEEVIIEIKNYHDITEAKEKALELSNNDGWHYATCFNTQDSFYSVDNKNYARTYRTKYV